MSTFQELRVEYENAESSELNNKQLKLLGDGLKSVKIEEIQSSKDGKDFIGLLRKFREAVAENDRLHGENYPSLLSSIFSVGEDGVYSNKLHCIFELIQNADDCDFRCPDDCSLDMQFVLSKGQIILRYNEVGFSPYNVFAITGIAEAAKNVSAQKDEIGEKGIGFKSVFGVSHKVLIQSGWFSFELRKDAFTVPVAAYNGDEYYPGTVMTLFLSGKECESIYKQIRDQYCQREALFSKNPLLFLNRLTKLKIHVDTFRSMEFRVTRSAKERSGNINRDDDLLISADLHDHESTKGDTNIIEKIKCTRYSYEVTYSYEACQSRYKPDTALGRNGGKKMSLYVVFPAAEYVETVGKNGALYSFLPTQLRLSVPIVCHVPFKLDVSRGFVDSQDENLWFKESVRHFSELIDYAYNDWCKTVHQNILRYLPGVVESLFLTNNGKELCLSKLEEFSGKHFLSLPLLFTSDCSYKSIEDVLSFDPKENISDPGRVHRMLGYSKFLFIPPEKISAQKYGIATEHNICAKLFRRSLFDDSLTAEVLDYLDSIKYCYNKEDFPEDKVTLSIEQAEEVLRHKDLTEIILSAADGRVSEGNRPEITVNCERTLNIADVLYEGFDVSDVPKKVGRYLNTCGGRCVCADIARDRYLPCCNALILSKEDANSSFCTFCSKVDKNDSFSIRWIFNQASAKLNECVDDVSISDDKYLRDLKNIRQMQKDALGQQYRSFIDLVLKSGTDGRRFLNELLQNADDCDYLSNVSPTFCLRQSGARIVTECNERGFSRDNIRAITAIGESTKNKLLGGDNSIGEKGIGFKSVFAIASKVRITSGNICFTLTAQEPTIPKTDQSVRKFDGTKMEMDLKEYNVLPALNDKSMLELCLCLRRLRRIEICNHIVTIEDSPTTQIRTVTIDKKRYSYKKYTHAFVVDDAKAVEERRQGAKKVSENQTIVCYVPGSNFSREFYLHVGLPTKHKIKIPMVIDAPFSLTTARESIETDGSLWNTIVRKEMYAAILEVMDKLKATERDGILKYVKFSPQRQGAHTVYVNDMFDDKFLTSYNFLEKLRLAPIIPTYDPDTFMIPAMKNSYRFPEAADCLFKNGDFGNISPAHVIDVAADANNSNYAPVLNALECEEASIECVLSLLGKYAWAYIRDENFRTELYKYLKDIPERFNEYIAPLPIIPVYGAKSGEVDFISWEKDRIYVKKNDKRSKDNYYILDEEILSKADCERIFGVNINEMNYSWEQNLYNDQLRKKISGGNPEEIYRYLLDEFSKGSFSKYNSYEVLRSRMENIPLKNQLGEIKAGALFVCNRTEGCFSANVIRRLAMHEECLSFAKYLECDELSRIHYENICPHDILTADEIEALQDDYFVNSDEILRGYYRDGLLPDKLLSEYDLGYLKYGRYDEESNEYDFPEKPVADMWLLKKHIKDLCVNPIKIRPVQVTKTERRGIDGNGEPFDLSARDSDARIGVLSRYMPRGKNKLCFCQMCRKVKPQVYIQATNIQLEPDFYFPEMRIALCLECSKEFEALRRNKSKMGRYIDEIKKAKITTEGAVAVPVGNDKSITFTATHLAEVQEILKNMQDKQQ